MAKRYIRLVGTATGSSVKKRLAFVVPLERNTIDRAIDRAIVSVDSVDAVHRWPTELVPNRARGKPRDVAVQKRGVPFAIR